MWTQPDRVRKYIGLDASDVSDEDLSDYITKAQEELFDQISVYAFEEVMSGDIDGSNTTFTVSNPYIADSNFDLVADSLDVEVYKWGTYGSIDTMSTIGVSTIYPDRGLIVLNTPPESTIEAVTCSYYFYPRKLNLNRLEDVTALLAAYYYVRTEMLLVPKQWMHGAYRFIKGTPAEELLQEYYRNLEILLGRMHKKKVHGEVEFAREGST
jgi:hypothetical protein